jgi:F0F1-type ATP synthase epsilon subunit
MPLTVEIVTPSQAEPPREVRAIEVAAEKGRLTILPGHAPLVCALEPGEARLVDPGGDSERWRLGRGTLTVARGVVTLLVQSAQVLR